MTTRSHEPTLNDRTRGNAASPRPARQRLLFAVAASIALALLLWGAARLRHSAPPRPIPAVALGGTDPQVAAAVRGAQAKVRANPDSGPQWGELGTILYVHNFQPQAVVCLGEAGRLDPQEPRWPYLRALALMQQNGAANRAIPDLKRAAALAPDTEEAPGLLLAETLLDQGRFKEAETLLKKALQSNPTSARALLGLGRLALAQGHLAQAKADLLKSSRSAPAKATQLLLSQTLRRLGDARGADILARQAAKSSDAANYPDEYGDEAAQMQVGKATQLKRGEQLIINGKFAQAVAQMQQTVHDYPKAGRAWMLLGTAYTGGGKPALGEKVLRKALLLDPRSAETFNHLGDAIARQGRNRDAIPQFKKALSLFPQSAEFHFNLGVCLFRLGDLPAALKEFETTLRLDPDTIKGRAGIAEILAKQGQPAAAIQQIQAALRLKPHDAILEKSLAQFRRAAAAR